MSNPCPVCETESDAPHACPFCGTPRQGGPTLPGALAPGTLLQRGAFAVGRVLGAGGFGITYAGVDRRLKRVVAIKELVPNGCVREGRRIVPGPRLSEAVFSAARARFMHEARVAARFQHPNIVHVYAFFEENDTGYLVMEMLTGSTLLEIVEQNGILAEADALSFVTQAAEGLRAVHAAGYVHRDIKPENLFLTEDGRIVLLDFGTAKARLEGQRPVTGLVSPGYAPPEQYQPLYHPNPRGDVYSLAATLYHLLTGMVAPDAPARALGQPLPDPSILSPHLRPPVAAAIMEAMSLDPAKRPPTVDAFLYRLHGSPRAWQPPAAPAPPPPAPSPTLPTGPDLAASLPSTAGAGGTAPEAPAPSRPAPTPGAAASHGRTPPPLLTARARLDGHRGMVRAVDFSADGEWLLSGAEDRTVRLWGRRSRESHGILLELDDWIPSLRVSPDGRTAVVASHDRTITLFDLETRAVTRTLRGPSAALVVAFSPDGRTLGAGFLNGRVMLWNERGDELLNVEACRDSIRGLAFSPDGQRLAFGTGTDARIHVWSTAEQRDARVIEGESGSVRCLAWSPDGTCIATAASDLAIRVWDLASGDETLRLTGSPGRVNALAFHPSGAFLASASADKAIRLWDLASGACVQALSPHAGEVLALAWSRDGRHLASGSQDETVQLFDSAS